MVVMERGEKVGARGSIASISPISRILAMYAGPAPAPDAYAVFLMQNGLTALADTVNFTVLTIYYVTVVHLDPLQLVLVGTAIEGTMLVFQVPTGILADVYSRRFAVIAGTILVGIGCLVTGSVPLFAAILAAETIRGVGESCKDGACEAWLAGEIDEGKLAHAFTRAAQVSQIVAAGAVVVSVALATINLRLPVLFAGVTHLALATYLIVAMPERAFRRSRSQLAASDSRGVSRRSWLASAHASVRASWQAARGDLTTTLRAGVGLVRRSPLLIAFLALALVFGAASEGFDRLWEAHLLLDIPFPALGHLQPVVWFGILQLALMPLAVAGLELLRRHPGATRSPAIMLVVLAALQGLGVLVFAFAGNFFLAVVALALAAVTRTLASPLRTAWLTRSISPRVRATVLSLAGQADALGQVAGGPGVGAIGKWISLRAAIACSGVLLLPAIPLYARMRGDADRDDARYDDPTLEPVREVLS